MIPTRFNPMGRDAGYFVLTVNAASGNLTYGFTPFWGTGGFCRVRDWGDGTAENATVSGTEITHTYSAAGTYKIKISADGTNFYFGGGTYGSMVYGCNFNWPALGSITSADSMFSGCLNMTATLVSLPPGVTIYSNAFNTCWNLSVNLSTLTGLNPATSVIANMFRGAGYRASMTGSIATFMRQAASVISIGGAFTGTVAALFSGDSTNPDYFEIELTTTEADQVWGFTPTSTRTGYIWYCADYGDGVYGPDTLTTVFRGTRVQHTFATPGTYHIKLAMNATSVSFDTYTSDNGNWPALGIQE